MSNVISVLYYSSVLLFSDELKIVSKIAVIVQAEKQYLPVHRTFAEYRDIQHDYTAESWKGIFFPLYDCGTSYTGDRTDKFKGL